VLLEHPFDLEISANSLGEFLSMKRSRLKVEVNIAQTHFAFDGESDFLGEGRSTDMSASVEAARLDSLDDLLQLDLPPLTNYRAAATLTVVPGRAELESFELAVEDTVLSGAMVVDRSANRPRAKLEMVAERVQLDDFDLGDWTPADPGAPEPAEPDGAASAETSQRSHLLDPAVLGRADAEFSVRVGEVASGSDKLGGGEVSLTLRDGRISLDPLHLSVPGGDVLLRASVKPGAEASDASLRVLVENFDFGVLARRLNPDTDLGGTMNMDVDLKASAKDFGDLMAGASGYFDLSGNPVNFQSGIVDLWAVNLISSVVTSSVEDDDASHINCVVSRWRMIDGVLSAEQLAVDTSRIRICGSGDINFAEQTFDLAAKPTAKRPEFFSLAAPLAISGTFEDFSVGLKGGALSAGTTAVKFAISPLTTPVKRLVKEDLPEDGSDVCLLPIGPRKAGLDELPGC
jgi:uncharacterized protein involved in outer membrane biogenesis